MRRFICPASMQPHALEVLRGAYDIPGLQLFNFADLPKTPMVLDVGANVGAFTHWAMKRWPEASVCCYEPEPENFAMLIDNTKDMDVDAVRVAVSDRGADKMALLHGKNNCGEHSTYDLGEQEPEGNRFEAPVKHPHALPGCAFLKVDTEGCELEIIPAYLAAEHGDLGPCVGPLGVAYEWHRPEDRWELGHVMCLHGYRCVGDDVRRPDRGICKWIRKDVELS